MQSRWGWLIAFMAVAAIVALAVDVATNGQPNILLLIGAAALAGTAAAWPVARSAPTHPAPPCMECGHHSFASTELGFCTQCGSSRVWQLVQDVR